MTPARKTAIVEAIRNGRPDRTICFEFGVEPEQLSEIKTAIRTVREFRRRGIEPRVLWANFRDLVPASECGITT